MQEPAEKTSPGGSPQGGFLFAGRLQPYNYAAIMGRLGKVTDARLAAEIGCDKKKVQRLRQSLGIVSFAQTRRTRLDRVLGHFKDVELAKAFGVTRQTVSARRKALGIPRASTKAVNARHRLQEYLNSLSEA